MCFLSNRLSNGMSVRLKTCYFSLFKQIILSYFELRFCATGTMGIIGDLTSGEILEQLIIANSITRIRNVVFMGMGEPL